MTAHLTVVAEERCHSFKLNTKLLTAATLVIYDRSSARCVVRFLLKLFFMTLASQPVAVFANVRIEAHATVDDRRGVRSRC